MSPPDTPEFQILLNAARHPLTAAEAALLRRQSAGGIRWKKVLKLARRHKVMPLVSFNLEREVPDVLPPAVHRKIQSARERQQQQAGALTDALLACSRLFQTKGIAAWALKGPALSKQLFDDVTLRSTKDLDVLVRPEDVFDAERVLLAAGYRHKEPGRIFSPRQWQAYAWLHHHYTYQHPQTRIRFELHWSFASAFLTPPAMIGQARARARTLSWSGIQLGVLAPEDTLAFLLVHGAKHKWARLKYVADLDAFVRGGQPVDWHGLAAVMTAWRLQRPLAQGFLLAHRVLGTPIPAPLGQAIAAEPTAEGLAEEALRALLASAVYRAESGGPFSNFHNALYLSRLRPGLPFRLKYLASFILYSLNDWSDIDFPDALSWLYFVIRPFRWIQRYFLK